MKLHPTHQQRLQLHQWLDSSRVTYNNTVGDIRKNGIRDWTDIRDDLVTATRYYCPVCERYFKTLICKDCGSKIQKQENKNLTKELKATPKHIRLASVRSVCTAYKSAFTNLKRGNITHFNVGFKSRKRLTTDSIEVEHKLCSISEEGFKVYSMTIPIFKKTSRTKNIKKRTKKQIPKELRHDLKILYDYRSDEFFVCIPVKQEIPKSKEITRDSVVLSCDSGVKTFQTIYDPSTGDCIQLNNRKELLQKLRKKIAEMKDKARYKHYKRFNDIISDIQWRFCCYLVRYPDCSMILLPNFESQEMKMRNHGFNFILLNMNKHYQFKQKLQWKCLKSGVRLICVDESYTTKTCGLCGTINDEITLSNREYNCINPECSYGCIDRDYHSARNIFIKTTIGCH